MDPALDPCPECGSEYVYESGPLLVCPLCAPEWMPVAAPSDEPTDPELPDNIVRDAVGNPLSDGDNVTVVKSLKVKGGGGKDIKIDAKVPGFGQMHLGSSVVREH